MEAAVLQDPNPAMTSGYKSAILPWPDGLNPPMPHIASRIMTGVPTNKAGPRKDRMVEHLLHKQIEICHALSFHSNEYETILANF